LNISFMKIKYSNTSTFKKGGAKVCKKQNNTYLRNQGFGELRSLTQFPERFFI